MLLAWVAKVAAADDVEHMANFQSSSDRDFGAKSFTAHDLHNIKLTRSDSCQQNDELGDGIGGRDSVTKSTLGRATNFI